MAKKTTTLQSTTSILDDMIAQDIRKNLEALQSGNEVSGGFDSYFDGFNWTAFKGNKSAATCGMSKDEFHMVKGVRAKYKDAWNIAKLPNFDQRWQYVTQCSKHYIAPEEGATATKSPEQKACEAARSLYRNAVEMGDSELAAIAESACGRLGIEIVMAE